MKNVYLILLLLLPAALAFAQPAPDRKLRFDAEQVARSEEQGRERYRQAAASKQLIASADFTVSFYRCEWEVDPAVRFIKGKVTTYFTITSATGSITFDMHASLNVDSVIFRGRPAAFQHNPDHSLVVSFQQILGISQKDSVTIFYQGTPAGAGNASFATSLQNGVPVMWTLSEPYGAKDWWPCRNDPNDKADSIDILLTYPEAYQSSSNGLKVAEWQLNGKTTAYWKHRYPIASYLVAFAITNYVTYADTARIGDALLPVRMYAYPAFADYFRESTRIASRFLERFSSLFGPYPFLRESYSQTQFNLGGGIEHQTNSFIGSNSNQLAVHELGHQWFGDQVTCGSWQDVWLNEGFASYMQFLYVEAIEPFRKREHLDESRTLAISAPDGSVKVSDTTSDNRIFDFRLTYAKGSYLVHMIRWKLGDSLFFRALRSYLANPLLSYRTARTADLENALELASGQDFTRFFKNWFEGEGYPSYQVAWSQNKNKWVNVRLSQTTSHPSVPFYDMPVPVQLKGAGRDTVVVLNHSINGQAFWVEPGFVVDSVLFDPELWLLSGHNTVTRVAEPGIANNIKIYPNPVADHIVISLANPTGKRLAIRLINTAGQHLFHKEVELRGMDELITVPFTNLPAGVYWLQVQGDGLNTIRKMVR